MFQDLELFIPMSGVLALLKLTLCVITVLLLLHCRVLQNKSFKTLLLYKNPGNR